LTARIRASDRLQERARTDFARGLLLGSAALLITGCASGSGLPQATERAIETYYRTYASEEGGRCPALFIDGFTRVEVVEDGPQRQVIDVRYLYGDRIKDGDDAECGGFNRRRFTLAKTEGGLAVVEMSGPRRR
jgi:hypothetical protein